MDELHVVLFGANGAGKTALVSQFFGNPFDPRHEPTIEDQYTKESCVNGNYFWLKILDTQGLEQYVAMRKEYVSYCDAYILVYDVSSETSVSEIEGMCAQIAELKSSAAPLVIVGCKSDAPEANPKVVEAAGRLARHLGKPHIVTSAKLGHNVNQVFRSIIFEYQKYALTQNGSNNFDAQSISSTDRWIKSSQRPLQRQITWKNSLLKLKKSLSQLKPSKSFRSIRNAVSTSTLRAKHKQPAVAQMDEPIDPNIQTVTDSQLESVLEFDDVEDLKNFDRKHRICTIM